METASELAFYGYLGSLGILVSMVLYAVTRWVASQSQFPRELKVTIRRPKTAAPPPPVSEPTTPYRETPTCPTCGQPVQTTPK